MGHLSRPLILSVLLLGACSFAPSHKDVPTPVKKPESKSAILILTEDAPSLETFMSGHEALNNLFKFGDQVNEKPETIHLRNPAPSIENEIAGKIQDQYKSLKITKIKSGKSFSASAKSKGLNSGYIINTEILEWDAVPHPKTRERYNFYLNAKTDVYDIAKGKVVASHSCKQSKSFDKIADAPGRYKLMKDDMKLLKRTMSGLTNECLAASVESIFKDESF